MLHSTKFTILAELLNFTLISINIKLKDCSTCPALTEILKSKKLIFSFLFSFFGKYLKLKIFKKLSEFEHKIYQNSFVLDQHPAIRLSISVISWCDCWILEVILNTRFGIWIQHFLSLVARWTYFRLQMNSVDTSFLRRKAAAQVIL